MAEDVLEPEAPPILPELPEEPQGPRILLVHPGASWSTADVHNGLRAGLGLMGAQTANYQLDVRIARSARWLYWNWKLSGKPGLRPTGRDAQYHAGSGILERVARLKPDWVLVVSGMFLDLDLVKFLKDAGRRVAVLLTESPYDDEAQAIYIREVDVAWTNERTSVAYLQSEAPRTRVHYLAHAWHPLVHVPCPIGEDIPSHDVLFIATGFPERIKLLRDVQWPTEDVGLYGFWPRLGSRNRLRKYVRGSVVENAAAAQMYQRAKVNLNHHRTLKGFIIREQNPDVTGAESLNPRVWELAATRSFFVTDWRAELDDIFGAGTVPTFTDGETLTDQITRWLDAGPIERTRVATRCFEAVQSHSWAARAAQVLQQLAEV